MKEKDGEILLDESDIRHGEYLFMNEWTNNGQLGGVDTWFTVIKLLLKRAGYKIVKEEK